MENKFKYSDADLDSFDRVIKEHGWIIYEDVINPALLQEMIDSLSGSYQKRREIQIANGIAENMDGTLHHLVERDTFALHFLDQKYCDAQIRHFLGGNYIINSLGAVINTKSAGRYVQNVHRDIRSFTGDFKLMLQFMVVLDDFTLENGATWFLSGSHTNEEKPDDEHFYNNADRAVAKKGSMIAFDANLWHAAGKNYTDQPRRALTGAFTRPFFKPQLDYPRALGYAFGEELNPHLRQVLGYNARIPENLQEYYQPVEKRMYQPGQG
ncbi:ectoine hydroxylase-related dioxygenase (phytanoyl-CoA dioxygenase family) [Mucilaginibacter yixingensis]|uniref:Ectoine hydroxylase-related dioxygenase (Phytanoyl-CoA dioxygenase family) n=1 Tax=Mucilaginibacter yixingensis TaxID=1295612 RepID=A0A2T5JCV8_9SPHI|nr:phytanoyl-CoA dioxygenase family protein [Mucilaginibacter yixingensis]PTQ99601.1 ectoine hydroxylase-related dioxygenase (phytanoyl-CoA dioxygenase family) [Mucilaginibacter yixingensis]